MTIPSDNAVHLTQDELVSCTLNGGSLAAYAHLDGCEACRNALESYRSTLMDIRTVFSTPPPQVQVFHCKHGLMKEQHSCTIEHPTTGDRLDITCNEGWLNGRLTRPVDSTAPEMSATAVRLFSRQGFVSSVPVGEDGTFLVRCLNTGERHSITIMLPADGTSLQLLSNPE